MINFKPWVEPTKHGNLRVRYRDPISGKKKIHIIVQKDERAMVDGKWRTAKWLAEMHCQNLVNNYHSKKLGAAMSSEKVEPLVETYLRECAANNLSPATLRHYGISLRRFIEECFIQTTADLVVDRITDWKTDMIKRLLEYSTIRGRLGDIRTFLEWLVQNKKLEHSPFGEKMMPAKKQKEPRFYTRDEFWALNNALTVVGNMAKLACNLAHDMGLRKIEIVGDGADRLGVLWEDIQWRKDGKADLILRNEVVKGQIHGRAIRLTPGVLALMGSRSSGPLVKISRFQLDHFFARARKIAKINPDLDIHGLRHTFAKNYLQSGEGNLASLQILLGHTDITTTQIYAKFEKSYLATGVELAYERRMQDEAIIKAEGQKEGQKEGHGRGKPTEIIGNGYNEMVQDSTKNQEENGSKNQPNAVKFRSSDE